MFERYWSEPLMTWAGLTFGDGLEPVFAWPETHDNQPKLFSILSSAHSNIGARDEPGEALSASSNQGLELNSSGQSEPGIMSHVLPRYWYYDLSSIYRDPIFIHDTNLLGSKQEFDVVHKNLLFIWYIFLDKNFSPALSQINTTSLCSHIPNQVLGCSIFYLQEDF